MSVTKPTKLSLEKALHLLRKPDARLVRLHSNNGGAGFYVWPSGGRRAQDDFAKSLEEGYRAIRERVAAGGRPWVPK